MDRLFVYGTLQPGAPNEHVLSGLGSWRPGHVLGQLADAGWGAAQGYAGLTEIGVGTPVAGHVLEAESLDWDALDAFEGDEYERRSADITLDDGSVVVADLYVLAEAVRAEPASGEPQADEAADGDGNSG